MIVIHSKKIVVALDSAQSETVVGGGAGSDIAFTSSHSLLYCGMMAPFHCCRRWAFQILSFPLFLCCSFRGFQPHI